MQKLLARNKVRYNEIVSCNTHPIRAIKNNIEENSYLFCFEYIPKIIQIYRKSGQKQIKSKRRNWGGALNVFAPSSRKSLPILKEYENQSKLFVDMNGAPVFALFSKTLFRFSFSNFFQSAVPFLNNINYLSAIIISHSHYCLLHFLVHELWIILISYQS